MAKHLFRPNPVLPAASKEKAELIVATLDFLATLTSNCQAAKRALVVKGDCVLNTLVNDVICGSARWAMFEFAAISS